MTAKGVLEKLLSGIRGNGGDKVAVACQGIRSLMERVEHLKKTFEASEREFHDREGDNLVRSLAARAVTRAGRSPGRQ